MVSPSYWTMPRKEGTDTLLKRRSSTWVRRAGMEWKLYTSWERIIAAGRIKKAIHRRVSFGARSSYVMMAYPMSAKIAKRLNELLHRATRTSKLFIWIHSLPFGTMRAIKMGSLRDKSTIPTP
eukprot:scaffold6161_cov158-Amphora_coffeaeformis.AAC.11